MFQPNEMSRSDKQLWMIATALCIYSWIMLPSRPKHELTDCSETQATKKCPLPLLSLYS